jgi:hypothetical protein
VWDGDLLFAPALYLYMDTLLRRVFLSYFHQLQHDGGMLLISAPLILVSACTARTHSHGWPLPPTLRSLAISHKAKLLSVAQAPEPAESESEPARIATIGEDPRNFTLAHSPFLATVDIPSLAAGADSANDLCPPSPPVLQFCLKSPKPRGFFPKLHGFPHKSRS